MRRKQEIHFLKTKNQILEENYQALYDIYGANAKLYHDMNNHLSVLYRLLEQEKYSQAMEYISSLSSPVRELASAVWTGIPLVDGILNTKAALAERKGIAMKINAEYPRNAEIASDDLCIILANLIDNAIEASGKETDGARRFVEVTIRRIPTFLLIRVRNNAPTPPRRRWGRFQTDKPDRKNHGLGLLSVEETVEKYEGTLSLEYEEGKFEASAILYY